MRNILSGFQVAIDSNKDLSWSKIFIRDLQQLLQKNGDQNLTTKIQKYLDECAADDRIMDSPCKCSQKIAKRYFECWHEVPTWKPPGKNYQVAGCLCRNHYCCRLIYLYDLTENTWLPLADECTYPNAFGFRC